MGEVNLYKGFKPVISGIVARNVVSVLMQAVLARFLLPEYFGEVALLAAYIYWIQNIVNTHVDKYYHTVSNSGEESLLLLIFWEIALLGLLGLILVIANISFDFEESNVVLFASLYLPVLFGPIIKLKVILEKRAKFQKIQLFLSVSYWVAFIVTVGHLYLFPGIFTIAVWRGLLILFEALLTLYLTRNYLRKCSMKLSSIFNVYRFSWPLIGSSLMAAVLYNIDYVIVGNYLDKDLLGYYWMAFTLSHYVLLFKGGLTAVILPYFAQSEKSIDDLGNKFNVLVRGLLLVFAVFAVLFSRVSVAVVPIIFGETWIVTAELINIMIFAVGLKLASGIMGSLLLSQKLTRQELLVATISLSVLVIAVFIGVVNFGILGAAYAILFSTILSTFISWSLFLPKSIKSSAMFYFIDYYIFMAVALLSDFLFKGIIYSISVVIICLVFLWFRRKILLSFKDLIFA